MSITLAGKVQIGKPTCTKPAVTKQGGNVTPMEVIRKHFCMFHSNQENHLERHQLILCNDHIVDAITSSKPEATHELKIYYYIKIDKLYQKHKLDKH